MAIAKLAIYDEGQSLGFWKGIGFDTPGYETDSSIRVKNIPDMVTKVLAAIGSQRERVEIFLRGVGSVNYQSIGAGVIEDSSGSRSLQVDSQGKLNQTAKIWLPRLVGRTRGIYLLGVDNKYDVASQPLFIALANLLPGIQIHNHLGDGFHIINYSESEKQPGRLRTAEERQRLRDSLKKLDKK